MSAEAEAGYRRRLSGRHIQMIALGGAIGTGLFYGSAEAIQLSGPSILLAYLLGGAIVFLVVRALGEMSVAEPVPGAFSYYAYRYWSPRAGFVAGWNYWFTYVAVSMAELAAVGEFVNYWLPGFPKWLTAAFFLVVITGANLLTVKLFGEFEFWLALIKVVAVILSTEQRKALKFPLPGGDFSTVIILVFMALVLILMFLSPGFRLAAIIGPVWVLFLLGAYRVFHKA